MGLNTSKENSKKQSQSKTLKNEVDSLCSVLGLSQVNTETEELIKKTNKTNKTQGKHNEK